MRLLWLDHVSLVHDFRVPEDALYGELATGSVQACRETWSLLQRRLQKRARKLYFTGRNSLRLEVKADIQSESNLVLRILFYSFPAPVAVGGKESMQTAVRKISNHGCRRIVQMTPEITLTWERVAPGSGCTASSGRVQPRPHSIILQGRRLPIWYGTCIVQHSVWKTFELWKLVCSVPHGIYRYKEFDNICGLLRYVLFV